MAIGSYAHFTRTDPDETDGGASTWYYRSGTMVAAFSKVGAGSVLTRRNNVDEYFIWAMFTPLTVTAGGETVEVAVGSLVIVPPGASTLSFSEAGSVWRGFTALNEDLLTIVSNSDEYPGHPDGVAPVDPWPMPPSGYKIRVYNFDDSSAGKPLCFRHRTAMTNFSWPIGREARKLDAMSPHNHDDFEQVSIIHSGSMVHHMRRAWSRDMNEWEPDEHVIVTAPAIAVSKPPDIHTTQSLSAGEQVGLIDYFSPPRWDFSNIEGMVVNHDEYPMRAEAPKSYAGVVTVYAADDPRSALNRTAAKA